MSKLIVSSRPKINALGVFSVDLVFKKKLNLTAKSGKTRKNWERQIFDQWIKCAAPFGWLKHTTRQNLIDFVRTQVCALFYQGQLHAWTRTRLVQPFKCWTSDMSAFWNVGLFKCRTKMSPSFYWSKTIEKLGRWSHLNACGFLLPPNTNKYLCYNLELNSKLLRLLLIKKNYILHNEYI